MSNDVSEMLMNHMVKIHQKNLSEEINRMLGRKSKTKPYYERITSVSVRIGDKEIFTVGTSCMILGPGYYRWINDSWYNDINTDTL